MIGKRSRLALVYILLFCLLLTALLALLRNRYLFWQMEALAKTHLLIASLLVLSVFVFRAFIPFLPSFVLYTLTGRLIPDRFLAFLLNLGGVFLLNTLSYTVGRLRALYQAKKKIHFSWKKTRKLLFLYQKYRALRESVADKTAKAIGNNDFQSLLFFTLSPFPKKFFGQICGKIAVRYRVFLAASVIGALPSMASATLLGMSLTDPASPVFYVSLALTVTVTVFSAILLQKSK